MIQISPAQKGAAPAKLVEARKQAAEWLAEYNQFASAGTSQAKVAENQARFLKGLEIPSSDYAPNEVKAQLVISHHGKCAYCETRIIHNHYGDAEHFRPKKGVTFLDKTGKMATIADAYFWRAFDWDNLFLSCGICNEQYKKNYFGLLPDLSPTDAERAYSGVGPLVVAPAVEKRQSPANPNLIEHAVLIDPGADDPRLFLRFDVGKGIAQPNPTLDLSKGDSKLAHARTVKTISALGLNRPALVEARRRHLLNLHLLLMPILNDWQALQAFAHFGALCAKEQNLVPRSEPLAGILAKHAQAAKERKAGDAAVRAFELLVASILPWAEYTGLALDAVVTWSIEEAKSLAITAQALQATTQASGGSANIGATHSLAPRIPATLHTTLLAQEPDYRRIIKLYCEERWSLGAEAKADQSATRRGLHQELNELIQDYESAWHDFTRRAKTFQTQELALRRTFLLEEVENYQLGLDRALEDSTEEPLVLACLTIVVKNLTPIFTQLPALKDLQESGKFLSQHGKLLRADIPAFYDQRILDADSKRVPSSPMGHWKKQHAFFLEQVDGILGKKPLSTFQKDFLENTHEDFIDLYNHLTDVMVRYRLNDSYDKTASSRAEPLKQGLQVMAQRLRDILASKPAPIAAPLVQLKPIAIRSH